MIISKGTANFWHGEYTNLKVEKRRMSVLLWPTFYNHKGLMKGALCDRANFNGISADYCSYSHRQIVPLRGSEITFVHN
jgi:hypothetical protein